MITNVMQVIKAIRNPEQAKKMAMQGLMKNNPQIAQILQSCLDNGQSPKEILTMAIQAGKINYSQFQQFKGIVNQYARFLPFKLDVNELNELESCFSQNKNNQGFRF